MYKLVHKDRLRCGVAAKERKLSFAFTKHPLYTIVAYKLVFTTIIEISTCLLPRMTFKDTTGRTEGNRGGVEC